MSDDQHTHNPKLDDAAQSNTQKDPDDWTTGAEAMTGAQASYLKLCRRRRMTIPPSTIR